MYDHRGFCTSLVGSVDVEYPRWEDVRFAADPRTLGDATVRHAVQETGLAARAKRAEAIEDIEVSCGRSNCGRFSSSDRGFS